ncbi:MAG: glycoside hydrolase family 95 protein [Treponema sp.]|nr:glycoside hydrolase family 95 protein [Treponema sp.]
MTSDRIFFNSPAEKWEEALPLGNGRLSAMIFGSPYREKIQLNEDSIWSGQYRDRNNPSALGALPKVRMLLDEGRAAEAEELCLETFSGIPATQCVYQSAGELLIDFSPEGMFGHRFSGTRAGPLFKDVSSSGMIGCDTGVRNYRRELDLSRALHTISFEHEGALFTRECFISVSEDLLALRFTAVNADQKPEQGKISFRASLDRGVFLDRRGNTEDCAFITRDSGIPFCAMIKVIQKGGTRRGCGGFITVEKADEALLLADIRTGFRETDYFKACMKSIAGVADNTVFGIPCPESVTRIWEQLLARHIDKHAGLYNRMTLDIKNNGEDVMRYFNFCRYLLMACSSPSYEGEPSPDHQNFGARRSLPANLQGIWNPYFDPPWGSDYTININTQMNYWPAGMCNLLETEQPLFDLTERMYPNGKVTAEVMYGCRGFTAHHNTDVWGDASPRDYWIPASYWTLGAAWLCIHIWEHYEYTQDKNFLNKYFYLLREACVFFVDFLVPGKIKNENGEPYLIVSPSSSPENSFIINNETVSLCAGCEMDNQILRKLFQSAVRAAEILNIQDTDTKQFASVLERIPSPAIHSNGTIREWNEEYEEAEPGHRHFSHLWALWPGDSITLDETPQLAEAARKTIDRRLSFNGAHTGWSLAWLINFYARLKNGEAARKSLSTLLGEYTLPNLFNNGPPFQIDGNFGALSGITQMLLQSRIRYNENSFHVIIDLLPALPREWQSGSIKGVRSKGNLELEFVWQNGKIKSLTIINKNKNEISILLLEPNHEHKLLLKPEENIKII